MIVTINCYLMEDNVSVEYYVMRKLANSAGRFGNCFKYVVVFFATKLATSRATPQVIAKIVLSDNFQDFTW